MWAVILEAVNCTLDSELQLNLLGSKISKEVAFL